jgi:CBS domain-containing protein
MQSGWHDKRLSVKAWMSAPTHQVPAAKRVGEAFRYMRSQSLRHLLVVEGGVLVGIVTERDVRDADAADQPVLGVIPQRLITVEEEESVANASRLMVAHRIGCLPVMRRGELVGIITNTDLLRALSYAVDPETAWAAEAAAL